MIKRCIAWGFVLGVGYGVISYASAFKSPWTPLGSPVLSALPAPSAGCSDKCK